MLSICLSILMFLNNFSQKANNYSKWHTVVDSTFYVSFECPTDAIVKKNIWYTGDKWLDLHVINNDTISSTFGNLFGANTILYARFDYTKLKFPEAATDWALSYGNNNWHIDANPSIGPSNKLELFDIDNIIILQGYQSIGQGCSEGYCEIASVPYAFVYIKGNKKYNITIQLWYDSSISILKDRFVRSVHVIEK
jgi:hypothetical protein